jgi:hypothetical protein
MLLEMLFHKLMGNDLLSVASSARWAHLLVVGHMFALPSPRHKCPDRNPDLAEISLRF